MAVVLHRFQQGMEGGPTHADNPEGGTQALRYQDGSISKLDPMIACDDMGTTISRLRDLLDTAETYRRHAFYESAAVLHLELAQAMERAWAGFEEILEDLDE